MWCENVFTYQHRDLRYSRVGFKSRFYTPYLTLFKVGNSVNHNCLQTTCEHCAISSLPDVCAQDAAVSTCLPHINEGDASLVGKVPAAHRYQVIRNETKRV